MHPLLAAALTSCPRARRAALHAAEPSRAGATGVSPSSRPSVVIRRASPPTRAALVRLGALDSDRSAGQLLAARRRADHACSSPRSTARSRPRSRSTAGSPSPTRPPRARRISSCSPCAPASSAATCGARAAAAPRRAAPAHVVTSGRCCRPARPPRRAVQTWSGSRGRPSLLRRSAARYGEPFTLRTAWTDAPMVVVSDPADDPRGVRRRRRTCCDGGASSTRARAVRRPELDPRPRRRRRTCASAS